MSDQPEEPAADDLVVCVRRLHRRDLNRTWEFLKRVFRDVNRETVEYQRPRTKRRFLDVYEDEGVEQLLFEVSSDGSDDDKKTDVVGYAECAYQISGSDNWMNERYFAGRDMRPLFVEEIAVSTDYQGRGIGGFMLEQLEHLARLRGCTHLVLEVAENNKRALGFYRARHFQRLDAAIFLAKKIEADSELLPARVLQSKTGRAPDVPDAPDAGGATTDKSSRPQDPPAAEASEKPAAKKRKPSARKKAT